MRAELCGGMNSVLTASRPVLAGRAAASVLGDGRALLFCGAPLARRPDRGLTTPALAGRGFAELLKLKQESAGLAASRVLKPGIVSQRLTVPPHIPKPPYADSGKVNEFEDRPEIHDAEGIRKMREAGKLAAETLEYAGSLAKPGVKTDAIDKAVHEFVLEHGAYPSPLNYKGFPKSVCTSVNECICHGIPDSRELEDGDILNIDVTVYLNGYHGDTSKMCYVGEVSSEAKRLCEVTQQARDEAISICAPGVPFKNIGRMISDIARKNGFHVDKTFVGHGVGRVFHAGPYILHHRNQEPGKMRVNQTFTIEPILCAGYPSYRTWKDDWTVVDTKGNLSAQFEHTLLVTEDGVEVLTAL